MRGIRSRNLKDSGSKLSPTDETHVPTDPREGKQFGVYRILRRLGSGGMGHVYLALDTRLGRHTALKFLPPELFADEESLQRLEQEARTASALNHPNILTIYEIGENQGELFIASEFVEGITLKKAIQQSAVDSEMAVHIATQIASALMAAHSAGIIHRDLKPANVMVRPDGYVKVIDFGLAKITDESRLGGSKLRGLSFEGSVVGTVDYMSPEQARGEEVDARTDLWSLGVLLYEMLSGHRPFAGETDSHVIVAILDRQPAPLPNLGALPSGIGKVVSRALMKDPGKRYQSAEEMLRDLERVDTSSARRRISRSLTPQQQKRHFAQGLAAAAALLLLSGAAVWWWGFGGNEHFAQPNWFRIDSVKQLTFNGRTLQSAISPDGKYLAFVVGDPGGMQSLHVKQIDQPSDEVRIPARKINYQGLTFSPDSRTIYETEEDETVQTGKLFAIPVIGDRPATPVVEDIEGPVAFSPGGDQIAFIRWDPGDKPGFPTRSVIELAKADGHNVTPLLSTTELELMKHVAWSPKGDKLAVLSRDVSNTSNQMAVVLAGVRNRKIEKLFPGWTGIGHLVWGQDGRSLVLTASANAEGRGRSQVRELALNSGRKYDLTKDLSGYSNLSMTSDGKRLSVIKIDPRATLWVSSPDDFAHGRSAISELQDGASLAWLDQEKLLVNTRRTGFPNLAVFRTTDQSESNLTNEPFREQQAEPVPGRDLLVLSSNRSGEFHIWRYDRAENRYVQLTFGPTYDNTPSVSPDGRWVVYTAWSSTTPSLYKVPVNGGEPVSLGNFQADNPRVSPDGKWVACQVEQSPDHWTVAIIGFDGKSDLRPIPNASDPFRWARDSKSLTSVITDPGGVSNVWRIPIDGSAPQQSTRFEDQSILTFAWSPGDARLACIRLQNYSDVMLYQRQ
jgi:serine/threonine protein kinase